MAFPRVVIAMILLVALSLLHEVGTRHDFAHLRPVIQTKLTTTLNGVPVYQSMSDRLADVRVELPYRLGPLPESANSPLATLSPLAGRSLLQSAALTPPASPAPRLAAR